MIKVAKCPKCENDTFKIEKREDKNFCYVICEKCNTTIGVLEDIDFKERLNNIVNNQVKLQGFINEKTNDLDCKVDKRYKELNDKLDEIWSLLKRIIN